MRIIAGKYKGHHLVSFNAEHIRPTTDRVKESLFSQLSSRIEGAKVLDLYSGTGNLSFECLSREAEKVTAVENHKASIKIINENLEKLKIKDGFTLVGIDVFKFIKRYQGDPFDIVLVDPPFTKKIAHESMFLLSQSSCLGAESIIVIESSKQERLDARYGNWLQKDQRNFGDKFLSVFSFVVHEQTNDLDLLHTVSGLPGHSNGHSSAFKGQQKGSSMLSKHVAALVPSPTLALAAKGKELSMQGHDVIALTVGEPDWQTYPEVRDKGIEVISQGRAKYTSANGILELRKAVADQFNGWFSEKKENKIKPVTAQNVTATSGAKFILFSALQSLLNEGDECIIPLPYWVSYPVMVELCRGTSIFISPEPDDDFKVTPKQLRAAITDRTKVFLFNSPSNPTGISYSHDELFALATVLKEFPNIVILSDDIYNQLSFDGRDRSPHLLDVAPELLPRLISVNGGSKAYAMTGWRIGWAIGPAEIINGMSNFQSQALGSASSISQEAAAIAVAHCYDQVANVRTILKDRSEKALESLRKVHGLKVFTPDSAFYVWADIKEFIGKTFEKRFIKDSRDFCDELLNSQYVVTVPGQEFGMDGYIRMSFALLPEDFERATQRIAAFCAML